MRLSEHLDPRLILIEPDVSDRDELFEHFADTLKAFGLKAKTEEVVRRLKEREEILSTGIGGGVAVPHAQIPGLGGLAMAVSVHPGGIDYPSLDNEPVRLVFCLLGDADTAADHLAGLARLARLARMARKRDLLEPMIQAASGEGFIEALKKLEGE